MPIRPASLPCLFPESSPSTSPPPDPGLACALSRGIDPLTIASRCRFWSPTSPKASQCLDRLWRHDTAVAFAATRIATENDRADLVPVLARAALLHNLAYWAIAAVDPEILAVLLESCSLKPQSDPFIDLLGRDAPNLGRLLAQRLRCEPLVLHAAFLHDQPLEPWRESLGKLHLPLLILQKARLWASKTPWALHAPPTQEKPLALAPRDPRLTRLIASVQLACQEPFVDPNPSNHLAQIAQAHARLLIQQASLAEKTRKARKARRRQASQLDHWLAQASSALKNQAARSKQERAADRLDALSEFAAGAAHELNNPLAVIQGRAQLLLALHKDPDSTRSLRAIISQTQRAHRMIRDLMYISRPPQARPRLCQPDAILAASADDLRDEARARGLLIRLDIPNPAREAFVDPDPLRHLAEVLLRNAIEASPPNSPPILVKARSSASTLDWTIKDSGPGLDPRSAKKILDPFYSGREAGRGLGLGLPRIARFLRLAGGTLRCYSRPGRGCSFQASLPLPQSVPLLQSQPLPPNRPLNLDQPAA